MTRKVIAFDLDDTLAVTKSPVADRMAELLARLIQSYDVCIITGGRVDQILDHTVNRLNIAPDLLRRLHLMPTCGAQYYVYSDGAWQRQYSEDLADTDKSRITEVLTRVAKEMGYWESSPAGEIIEDRGSQVTFSALGQQALPEAKYTWDPDGTKRQALYDRVSAELDDFEVRIDGATSLNITRIGIDKAYGMERLMEKLDLQKQDILFVGDKLSPGGNDYPVKLLGIDTIAVERWQDTAFVIEGIIETCQ